MGGLLKIPIQNWRKQDEEKFLGVRVEGSLDCHV